MPTDAAPAPALKAPVPAVETKGADGFAPSTLAAARKARPTYDDLKAKHGPNWGLGHMTDEAHATKAANTALLSDANRKALIRGTIDAVINQDPGHEVRSAIRVLIAKADNVPLIEAQERIRIDIFLRDNLP